MRRSAHCTVVYGAAGAVVVAAAIGSEPVAAVELGIAVAVQLFLFGPHKRPSIRG